MTKSVCSWACAVTIGASLFATSAVLADKLEQPSPPPPPAQQVSAAKGQQVQAFFGALMDSLAANKDDCSKMATGITKLVDANVPLLRELAAIEKAGTRLPAAVEAAIRERMAKTMPDVQTCMANAAVQAAMMRLSDPDAKPPVVPASYPEVKAPVAADLVTYSKGLKGNGELIATIKTSVGTIHCQLFGDKAPLAVANFVGLATGKKAWVDPKTQKLRKQKPFYDGLSFHRVIPGFMIQGGDPLGSGIGGPGYTFVNEKSELKMAPGALAMANAGPDTNGSQFFITDGTPSYLDGNYTIFGTCKETDVVVKIENVTRTGEHPDKAVTMKVTIARGKL